MSVASANRVGKSDYIRQSPFVVYGGEEMISELWSINEKDSVMEEKLSNYKKIEREREREREKERERERDESEVAQKV